MALDQNTRVMYPSLYDLCDRYSDAKNDVNRIINYILVATEVSQDVLRARVVTYEMVLNALKSDLAKFCADNEIDPTYVSNACRVLVKSDDEIVRKIAIDMM
jgi:hypothetical protein